MKIILLILSLVMTVSCSRHSSLVGAKPVKNSVKKDNFKIVFNDVLKKRDIESMIYKAHPHNGELWLEAMNNKGNLSLFKQEDDGFLQIDLSFLQDYELYVQNKYIYDDNHYIVFYSKENYDRQSDAGLAIIKDGQVVYNQMQEESYFHSYDIAISDGVVPFVLREEGEDNSYKMFWYDGLTVNSVQLPTTLDDVSQPVYLNNKIYFIGRENDEGNYDTKFYSIDRTSKNIEEVSQSVIDNDQWSNLYNVQYKDGKVYFITNVPTVNYLYNAVVELSSTGLRMVSNQYNSINDYEVGNDGQLFVATNSIIEMFNINVVASPSIVTYDGNFERFFTVLGQVFFTTYVYDNNDYQSSINVITSPTESSSVLDLPVEAWLGQAWDDGSDVFLLLYGHDGESYIRKASEGEEGLTIAFDIKEENGFTKNIGYYVGDMTSFYNNLCFRSEEMINNNERIQRLACYNGSKLEVIFEEISVDGQSNEYINNNPVVSGGKMFFKTNMGRLFIVNQDMTFTIRENMDIINEILIYDGANLYFIANNESNKFQKMNPDFSIEDAISPLFVSDSISRYRRYNSIVIFRAEDNNEELKYFKLDDKGVFSETVLETYNLEYMDNTKDYLASSDGGNRIYNIKDNILTDVDDTNSDLIDLVVKGDSFWVISYKFPYSRYIFRGDISTGALSPIEEDDNFSRREIGYGRKGVGPGSEEVASDINLDPDDLVYHNNHLYWIGNNENNYRIVFRKNITTGEVQEFFHPDLNPRNYSANSLTLVGDRLYFRCLAHDVHLDSVLGELQLDETEYNEFNFYKEEDMLPENFKALGGYGPI